MATAFAERERNDRELDVDIVTGGTDPATRVHDSVIEVMEEVGLDLSSREPRKIRPEDVEECDYIVTMGCSVGEFAPEGWDGVANSWALEHPGGDDLESLREQRDEIAARVSTLFDLIEGGT